MHISNRTIQSRRRAFSLIEMMMALAISSMLLTAALVALDTMFKSYKQTTESASTHVISRIVMNRLLGMIRTGSDFGPIPNNVLDTGQNPRFSDYFEYVSKRDDDGDITQITRIEYRRPGQAALLQDWGNADAAPIADPDDPDAPPIVDGPGELWLVNIDPNDGDPLITSENPLISGVRSAIFTLHYDVGPMLVRGTADLVIEPNDSVDLTIGADSIPETIRLVASAAPRQSIDD